MEDNEVDAGPPLRVGKTFETLAELKDVIAKEV